MPLLDLIVGIASLLTLAYGGYLAIYGEINIGQFISFNSYVTMLVWPMMAVGECITSVSQGLASLRRIQEIFDAKPEIVDGDMVDPSIQTLKGDISIEHLSFAYPDQPTVPVLEDVSVHVKAGETLAVLGRTGSGKSTLPSLLMRLYDVPDGMITIDGHNLREIPLARCAGISPVCRRITSSSLTRCRTTSRSARTTSRWKRCRRRRKTPASTITSWSSPSSTRRWWANAA